ncbi:TetR/AcrR family transcriptional regulator [Leucobacter weissii]|uniref:TetR/AcrR family transcriptional regulator n=1 Tax=Leucobacter weissii TaxID=1983706 RepID=A0A939MN07_9MICO|nr:TetR/AcrR family transcriptional regulator [Leucobacter weissii]
MAVSIQSEKAPPEEKNGKTRERRNRNDSVIDEAIAVMSEKGYAATSIQEIADRVGVLKGSLYHYFSSKEELLFRIIEKSHQDTSRISAEVGALDLPPLEHLLEHIRRTSEWFLRNRERAHIYFTEVRNLSGERHAEAIQWGRMFETDVSALVTAGQENGTIRDDLDQRLVTRYIIGTMNNLRSWPSRPGSKKQFGNDQIVDAAVTLIADSIRAGSD